MKYFDSYGERSTLGNLLSTSFIEKHGYKQKDYVLYTYRDLHKQMLGDTLVYSAKAWFSQKVRIGQMISEQK